MIYIRRLLICVVCLFLAIGCNRDSPKQEPLKPNSPSTPVKSETQKKPITDEAKVAGERDAALRKELKNLLAGRKRPNASVILQRAGSVTVPESDGWRQLIQTLSPDVEKRQAAFIMMELDPLFKEDGTFLADKSEKYRMRFKSIPQPAIKAWAGHNQGSSDVSAAIMLMQIDPLFENDQFQSSRLDSALRILKELKENKDK